MTDYDWDHRNRLRQVVTKDATDTVLQTVGEKAKRTGIVRFFRRQFNAEAGIIMVVG